MGIRLITYDRPGYGESDRHPGRQVVDAAEDVLAIAEALRLDRFAVVGRSGGAPHALACAAKLSPYVTRAAAMVSLAPPNADGLDWFAGMAESNVREFNAAWQAWGGRGRWHIDSMISRNTSTLATSAASFLRSALASVMPDDDRKVIADPAFCESIVETYQGAMVSDKNLEPLSAGDGDRRMLVGWLDDALAFCRPWGFDLEDITIPVLLWHGEEDVFSPVSHSKWLARHIKHTELVVEPGSAHFRALEVLPHALRWLVRPDSSS
jgi:pimeloyl-ACP methyl ester carboxylesterase